MSVHSFAMRVAPGQSSSFGCMTHPSRASRRLAYSNHELAPRLIVLA